MARGTALASPSQTEASRWFIVRRAGLRGGAGQLDGPDAVVIEANGDNDQHRFRKRPSKAAS